MRMFSSVSFKFVSGHSKIVPQPVFQRGLVAAALNSVLTYVLKTVADSDFLDASFNPAAYSSFTFMLSVFIAFRASQAYLRFKDGSCAVFNMTASFIESASCLLAATVGSQDSRQHVHEFKGTVVRLFSLLSALTVADIDEAGAEGAQTFSGDEAAFHFDLIDLDGIDKDSLALLYRSHRKIDLVVYWIQAIVFDAQRTGVLVASPPLLTRALHELNNAMGNFHAASRITEVPFPRPYCSATKMVLVLHWMMTPLAYSIWVSEAWSSSLLAFVQVFMLWSLDSIADELQNPFGSDVNDMDMKARHDDFNTGLLSLMDGADHNVPTLVPTASKDLVSLMSSHDGRIMASKKSMHEVFSELKHNLGSEVIKHVVDGVKVTISDVLVNDHGHQVDLAPAGNSVQNCVVPAESGTTADTQNVSMGSDSTDRAGRTRGSPSDICDDVELSVQNRGVDLDQSTAWLTDTKPFHLESTAGQYDTHVAI